MRVSWDGSECVGGPCRGVDLLWIWLVEELPQPSLRDCSYLWSPSDYLSILDQRYRIRWLSVLVLLDLREVVNSLQWSDTQSLVLYLSGDLYLNKHNFCSSNKIITPEGFVDICEQYNTFALTNLKQLSKYPTRSPQ